MFLRFKIPAPVGLLVSTLFLLTSSCAGEPKPPAPAQPAPAEAEKNAPPAKPEGEAAPAKQGEEAAKAPAETSATPAETAETQAVFFGKGVAHSLKIPKAWKSEQPSNNMRLLQAVVAKHVDDAEDAEFTVTKASGGVDANITRWANNLFGGEASLSNRRTLKTAGDKEATLADYEGTYTAMGFGPKKAEPKKDYKMYGAIVVAEDGEYFIRLTGPKLSVEKWKKDFDAMVKSFQ